MFDTLITDEQRNYAWDLVSRHNYGNRGVFDGTKERQYTGLLGEVVMADALGFARPDGNGGFDHGIDFTILGKRVDLKTMGRTCPVRRSYVNNYVASQFRYDTEVFVFASINKQNHVMTVCGTMPKVGMQRFLLPAGSVRTRRDGTTFEFAVETYEIPNTILSDVVCWQELVWKIGSF